MISGVGVWTENRSVNYLTSTCDFNSYEGPDKSQLAGRTAQALLSINLECAECHDHPFDAWTRKDFQGLAAFFASTKRTPYAGLQDLPEDLEGGAARPLYQPQLLPDDGRPRERLAAWLTDPGNRPFARTVVNRLWTQMFGRPLVGTFASIPLDGPFPPTMELLVDDLIAHQYDLSRLLMILASSRAFQLESVAVESPASAAEEEVKETWASYPLTRLRPEQQANAILQISRLRAYDQRVHFSTRIFNYARSLRFREQFNDLGEKELGAADASVSQKLLVMNGDLIRRGTQSLTSASRRIALLCPTDDAAVQSAYLVVLTRSPTQEEESYFAAKLSGATGEARQAAVEDLVWTLANSVEFAWNH
jgi:hypothetical protein